LLIKNNLKIIKMKSTNLVGAVLGLALSFAVVYGYAYVVGKGWRKSQD
jgi:hypothetical protein